MSDAVRTSIGTMALPEGGRVDFDRLRRDRRRRLFDAMATEGLDALVLGRPANVLYASGARQLWTAGARPFGPACVVVASTGRVHLLSVWDEGVPDDIANDHLFPLSWNPANIAASVQGVGGLGDARRIGTDSLSPGFPRLLEAVAPGAEVVDGTVVIRKARSTKTADELACISTATAVAEAGLAAMVATLRAGVTERELLAAHLDRIAALGAPTPPTEAVACATRRQGAPRLRRVLGDEPVAPGDLVALDAGAMYAGYEGGVGRTWPVPPAEPDRDQRNLAARCRTALDAVIDACRAGATGADLLAAWIATGEPLPPVPLAHGVGLGMEPPVIGAGVGDDAVLGAGTVLAVTSWVAADGVGGFLERDLVLVGDGGAEVLSRFGRGPTAEEDSGA